VVQIWGNLQDNVEGQPTESREILPEGKACSCSPDGEKVIGVEHWWAAKGCVFSPRRIVGNEGVGVVMLFCLLTVFAKEQNTARRAGKWWFPGWRL
jgi:hypothetical protein